LISPTFYAQLLQKQKKTDGLTVFLALLGSVHVKAARKMLMNLTPGVNYTNFLQAAFMNADPKSTKKTNDLTVFFCAFAICVCKSWA